MKLRGTLFLLMMTTLVIVAFVLDVGENGAMARGRGNGGRSSSSSSGGSGSSTGVWRWSTGRRQSGGPMPWLGENKKTGKKRK